MPVSWLPRMIKKCCLISYLCWFVPQGERVSGKGADLYEMCDELDAILRGKIMNMLPCKYLLSKYAWLLMVTCIFLQLQMNDTSR